MAGTRIKRTLRYLELVATISALLGVLTVHVALQQLSPPNPPVAVCGNSILNGPASAPGGAITVPAGDNSSLIGSFLPPDTTYYFATGTHTFGTGQFNQLAPGNNDVFIGAPGAILDGQGLNHYMTGGTSTGVTIEYLTIQNFDPPGGQGAVNTDSAESWTMAYDTIQDNIPGAGTMLGTNDVMNFDCMTENGEYGFNSEANPPDQAFSQGAGNLTIENSEISYNNVCNWEDVTPFPITPPSGCTGAGQFNGCGCSGGGKFWQTYVGSFVDNYVLNNYSTGAWWDTNNIGWLISGNYWDANWGSAITYEISYDANITANTFVDNAWGAGALGGGFPQSAVYISESGSDTRLPGPYNSQFSIVGNQFYDNWGGVVLWENANRYCGSIANSSAGACTLVNLAPPIGNQNLAPAPQQQKHRRGGQGGGRAYGIYRSGPPYISLVTCATSQLLDVTPYINDCRWKTQNAFVAGNLFDFSISDMPASCTEVNLCGFNGLFSETGTFPPYLGNFVPDNITFNQNNQFTSNIYCGIWQFDALLQGNVYSYAQWTSSPYNQDTFSTVNSPMCSPGNGPPVLPGRSSQSRGIVIPYRR